MTDLVMEARHVYKTYRTKKAKKEDACGEIKHVVEAVKDVSLKIRKGDIKLIFGPSGSEKALFSAAWPCLIFQTLGKSTSAMNV